MQKSLNKLNRGFTIIEIMIVLVIAGLILVIVFLAIPQLQRTQRDNARQSAVVRLKAEMETYASNNQGRYPFGPGGACDSSYTVANWDDFYCRYIDGKVDINDPSGSPIITQQPSSSASATTSSLVGYANGMTLPGEAGVLSIIYGAKCEGENVTASGSASTNSKNYVMIIGLDRENTRYCVDSG